jgi:hypothetical protein
MRALLLAAITALCFASQVRAVNYIADCGLDAECLVIKAWYSRVRVPDGTIPCCGEADAYWASDHIMFAPDGGYYVTIEDDRDVPNRQSLNGSVIYVPADRIDPSFQGNPTGHTIVFVRAYDMHVYCFFPNING